MAGLVPDERVWDEATLVRQYICIPYSGYFSPLASIGENFTRKFFSHINDYTVDLATFTTRVSYRIFS